ncbi:hypothetical protein ACL02T_11765 [Pseudonocardia sp. RS010]|uniref:hypothetical protein n=1 Tax=Pseudonocardia sp. RS010 TaxID=3385979 RepID=UPI0039A03AE2
MSAHPAVTPDASRAGLSIAPLVDAARMAAAPEGSAPWFVSAVDDGVALRSVVRRWSHAEEPPARLTRVAAGAGLRAVRLAVAAQGRRPQVTHPGEEGLLAVVRPGEARPPRPLERALHGALRDHGRPRVAEGPSGPATRSMLRRAAEMENAWLRRIGHPVVPGDELGPAWPGPLDEGELRPAPDFVLVGAAGRVPHADLRTGQAVEALRLTAALLGLRTAIVAAPADPAALRARLPDRARDVLEGARGNTVAVLEFWRDGVEPA